MSGNRSRTLPSISVALATHNGAKYVGEQLRSILNQVPAPIEIVVSDDASTDGTVNVVRSVFAEVVDALAPPRPHLIVLENSSPLGVTANFEQACRECSADLIALSDQDDVWESGRLEKFVERFESVPELTLANSDASLIDDRGRPIGRSLLATIRATRSEKRELSNGAAFDVLIRRNLVTGATVVFRRELLNRALPFAPTWLHDEWLAIIAAATGTVGFIDEPLIRYRQHSTNQIGASRLTLSRGFSRIRVGRSERNARLLAHAIDLRGRIGALKYPVHNGVVEGVEGKLRHEQFRSTLPPQRHQRLFPVLRAVANGAYRTYSRGTMDALRDLIQPL